MPMPLGQPRHHLRRPALRAAGQDPVHALGEAHEIVGPVEHVLLVEQRVVVAPDPRLDRVGQLARDQ